MTIVWIVLGLLVFLVIAIVGAGVALNTLGKRIPTEHTATSVIQIAAPVEQVFDAIADIQSHPSWATGTTRVDPLPPKGDMPQARVHMGRNSFVLVQTRCDPPKLLERTISDDHEAFSGTWLYRLSSTTPPAGSAALPNRVSCQVKLTETGRVNQPIARAMMKYLFGYHMYTNKHLAALARKFGDDARPHRA